MKFDMCLKKKKKNAFNGYIFKICSRVNTYIHTYIHTHIYIYIYIYIYGKLSSPINFFSESCSLRLQLNL